MMMASVSHALQEGTGSEPGCADRTLARGRSTHIIIIGKINASCPTFGHLQIGFQMHNHGYVYKEQPQEPISVPQTLSTVLAPKWAGKKCTYF